MSLPTQDTTASNIPESSALRQGGPQLEDPRVDSLTNTRQDLFAAGSTAALAMEFSTLPAEYQNVLCLAQERHNILVRPLQELKGGRTDARLYLVTVCDPVRHLVLKLDRISRLDHQDEWTRHSLAASQAPPTFAKEHMADMVFDRVEANGAIAIFYAIAGQSLYDYRPAAGCEQSSQLGAIFSSTHTTLLEVWNSTASFDQVVHPQKLLSHWLDYRIGPEGHIETFLEEVCHIHANTPGLLIEGNAYPNPLAYARDIALWAQARPIDVLIGFQHGDLNLGNILVSFAADKKDLSGYYLIDFSLFKAGNPLFYDQTYLEMAYLLRESSRISFSDWVGWITAFAEQDILQLEQAPVTLAGACTVIGAGRSTFDRWLQAAHPSLYDDLWGQYWLAAVAAGLNFCNKPALKEQERMAGLIFAAVHLKRYCARFGAQPPVELAYLYDANQKDEGASHRGMITLLPPSGHNLPTAPTPLIGRGSELAKLHDALLRDEVRLITLTGPAGTGKTRLGLEVAKRLSDHFQHGVFFVSLAEISAPDLVPSKIAQALGVRESGKETLQERLQNSLRDKHTLLMLDNFEHVIDAASAVADLLAAAPQLKLLVTSRALLNLRGEHGVPVPPLAIPDRRNPPTLMQLGQYEAIRLFVEQAGAANPQFVLTDDNASSVMEICLRLDGIPLAIELAAARVRVLTVKEIAERLDDRFRLLVDGRRAVLPRQRTLRALIDWSHDLLSESERALLRRLALFAGGFTLQTAEEVCSGHGIEAREVLDILTALVDQSMVLVVSYDSYNRYAMLETLQKYALEQLIESGESDEFAQCFAAHFVKMAEEAYGALWGPQQGYWLAQLDMEHDNMRAALEWLAGQPDHAAMLLRLAGSLWRFWDIRGCFSEGLAWLERALEMAPHASTYWRANGLRGAGMLARRQGDYVKAKVMHQQSLVLFQERGCKFSIARELDVLGDIAQIQGDFANAIELHREGLSLRYEIGDEEGIAVSLAQLGRIARSRGRYLLAEDLLKESLELHRQRGDQLYVASSLNNLGLVASLLCEYERAAALFEEALALSRALNDKMGISDALQNLGNVAKDRGNMQRAKSLYQECLALRQQIGNKRGAARVITDLAEVAVCQGQYALAEQLTGRSRPYFQEINAKPGIMAVSMLQAFVAHYRGDHERASSLAGASLVLATDLDIPRGIAYARAVLGLEAYAQGNLPAAQEELEQALAGFRKVDDKRNIAYILVNLARTAYRQGDHDRAIMLLDDSLSISRKLDIRWSLAYALEITGLLQRSQGDYSAAAELFQESLRLSIEQENQQGIANCLGALGGVAVATKQLVRAAHLFAAAEKLRLSTGVGLGNDDRREIEHYLALVKDQLDDIVLTASWSEGCTMSVQQAVEEACSSAFNQSVTYAMNYSFGQLVK